MIRRGFTAFVFMLSIHLNIRERRKALALAGSARWNVSMCSGPYILSGQASA